MSNVASGAGDSVYAIVFYFILFEFALYYSITSLSVFLAAAFEEVSNILFTYLISPTP
jgi:hypothetical protein